MKNRIGTCIDNPFGTIARLDRILSSGRRCSRKRFLKNCDVDKDTRKDISDFPNDYKFFYTAIDGIWYFEWSCIDVFFQ